MGINSRREESEGEPLGGTRRGQWGMVFSSSPQLLLPVGARKNGRFRGAALLPLTRSSAPVPLAAGVRPRERKAAATTESRSGQSRRQGRISSQGSSPLSPVLTPWLALPLPWTAALGACSGAQKTQLAERRRDGDESLPLTPLSLLRELSLSLAAGIGGGWRAKQAAAVKETNRSELTHAKQSVVRARPCVVCTVQCRAVVGGWPR